MRSSACLPILLGLLVTASTLADEPREDRLPERDPELLRLERQAFAEYGQRQLRRRLVAAVSLPGELTTLSYLAGTRTLAGIGPRGLYFVPENATGWQGPLLADHTDHLLKPLASSPALLVAGWDRSVLRGRLYQVSPEHTALLLTTPERIVALAVSKSGRRIVLVLASGRVAVYQRTPDGAATGAPWLSYRLPDPGIGPLQASFHEIEQFLALSSGQRLWIVELTPERVDLLHDIRLPFPVRELDWDWGMEWPWPWSVLLARGERDIVEMHFRIRGGIEPLLGAILSEKSFLWHLGQLRRMTLELAGQEAASNRGTGNTAWPKDYFQRLAISPDARWVAGRRISGRLELVRPAGRGLWEGRGFHAVAREELPAGELGLMALASKAHELAVVARARLYRVDLRDLTDPAALRHHEAADWEKRLLLWRRIGGSARGSLDLSPDRQLIAVALTDVVRIFRTSDLKQVASVSLKTTPEEEGKWAQAVRFGSQPGRLWIASVQHGAGRHGRTSYHLVCHDWHAQRTIASLDTPHTNQIYELAISPTRKHVATCSYDGQVTVWDTQTLKQVMLVKPEEVGPGLLGSSWALLTDQWILIIHRAATTCWSLHPKALLWRWNRAGYHPWRGHLQRGHLWLAVGAGFCRVDPGNGKVLEVRHDPLACDTNPTFSDSLRYVSRGLGERVYLLDWNKMETVWSIRAFPGLLTSAKSIILEQEGRAIYVAGPLGNEAMILMDLSDFLIPSSGAKKQSQGQQGDKR